MKRTYFFNLKLPVMQRNDRDKVIEIQGIGPVIFTGNTSGRFIRISVRPGTGVVVSLPAGSTMDDALAFVRKKRPWIKKQQVKIAGFEKATTYFDETVRFSTRERQLKLWKHEKATIKTSITRDFIHVWYPGFAEVADERIQQAVRRAITEAWRLEAKKYLPKMTEVLARRYGFVFKKVSIRNNKTRWGSCSKDNSISLNLHLIRLPDHLCEYVILHELAHTIHKHHQKPFWQLLDSVTGNARKLDKELNNYRISVW